MRLKGKVYQYKLHLEMLREFNFPRMVQSYERVGS